MADESEPDGELHRVLSIQPFWHRTRPDPACDHRVHHDLHPAGGRALVLYQSGRDFHGLYLVSCPRNSMYFVAIKMGRRQGARSGASRTTFYTPGTLGLEGSMKVVRDVTDEQRGRRPIFIATLRAGAGWPFFCFALSARMIQIGALVRALKNSQLTSGKIYVISG